MPLTSVAGGSWNDGNWLARAGFCGPGSLKAPGVVLILPSGGPVGVAEHAGGRRLRRRSARRRGAA